MQIEKQRQGYKLIQIQSGRHEEIPNDWNVVTLKNLIIGIKSGFASGARDENGVVQLRMNNITDYGTLDFSKILKVPIPDDIKQYDLKKDDVLFNNTNSLDLIGKTTIVDNLIDHTFSNHITRIRTDKTKLVPYFLMLIFLKYKEQAIFRSICNTHVGQSGIGKNELLRLKIICSPLIEQQKIASILSNVDSLIQQTQKIIEQTQRLKKGLMQKLLTKGIGHNKFKESQIGKIPEDWELSTIGKTCLVGTGGTPSRNNPRYYEGKIPWVKTTEVNYNIIISTEELITEEALNESSTKLYPKGTILFAMYGQGITRGKCAILGINATINQACAAIQPQKKIEVLFLFYWLQDQYDKLRTISQGSHQSNFNLNLVRKITIPIPPKIEQQKIISILSSIKELIEEKQEYNSKLETLKKGLMQKLLTGQIRVKV